MAKISVVFGPTESEAEGFIRIKTVRDELGQEITARFVRWCWLNNQKIRRTKELLAAIDEYSDAADP
jgi:hypothetical protein